ncbi:MAG: class I SAM-dependent methyltransferase [Nanoarchaeota archaeon]|nr:class I SAM-dependent methyltransferase [Nanoarchaeota archaeon]MBU1103115.1 class I SAM-dependent methyltransferase [Nanoarchaeota archaeon]
MIRDSCLICDSKKLNEVIDLGMHPFADTFIPQSELSHPDVIYPLIMDLCADCGGIQLRCVTPAEDRYCSVDYSYTSSNSGFSRNHWIQFASDVSRKVELKKDAFVVEIGSNDGFLAQQFAVNGARVLGVDPSGSMMRLAAERNIKTVQGVFNLDIASNILREHGQADLIVANNVFNHSNEPLSFAVAVRHLLAPQGAFVYELPYWYEGFKTGKFDQIYHEHVTYFTARSSAGILKLAGMFPKFVETVDYHGGSLRVYAQNEEDRCSDLEDLVSKENEARLFEPGEYKKFLQRITSQRNRFLTKFYEAKNSGVPIIAVGAAAKGNTLLNFYNLGHNVIDLVTDASSHKQGKYTPLTRIPIVGDEIFSRYPEVYALILSWNIATQLKRKLYEINPRIRFLVPE